MNSMGCLFNLLFILSYLYTRNLSYARSIEKFQFQCYGTRTLCTYPREFCSSNIKKCVECSEEVCTDPAGVPLACLNFCSAENDEQEQTSWFTPFIVCTTFLFLTNLVTGYLLFICRRNRRSERSDPASSSLLKPKEMVQPSNAITESETKTGHYCEKKLKDVPPAQNPHGKYEPTTHHVRCTPTNE